MRLRFSRVADSDFVFVSSVCNVCACTVCVWLVQHIEILLREAGLLLGERKLLTPPVKILIEGKTIFSFSKIMWWKKCIWAVVAAEMNARVHFHDTICLTVHTTHSCIGVIHLKLHNCIRCNCEWMWLDLVTITHFRQTFAAREKSPNVRILSRTHTCAPKRAASVC